ncbi:hypothetical protein AYI68_g4070 [Smittium mucronatum]|uniref:Uncharacterized protein n=1 Tax=Smittium mucronatum TaxID=133383 RepID=A0A1R0GY52_9FUNG|nr:hypothetical protein AYI68_g4070 [Smittium mucronatum]
MVCSVVVNDNLISENNYLLSKTHDNQLCFQRESLLSYLIPQILNNLKEMNIAKVTICNVMGLETIFLLVSSSVYSQENTEYENYKILLEDQIFTPLLELLINLSFQTIGKKSSCHGFTIGEQNLIIFQLIDKILNKIAQTSLKFKNYHFTMLLVASYLSILKHSVNVISYNTPKNHHPGSIDDKLSNPRRIISVFSEFVLRIAVSNKNNFKALVKEIVNNEQDFESNAKSNTNELTMRKIMENVLRGAYS